MVLVCADQQASDADLPRALVKVLHGHFADDVVHATRNREQVHLWKGVLHRSRANGGLCSTAAGAFTGKNRRRLLFGRGVLPDFVTHRKDAKSPDGRMLHEWRIVQLVGHRACRQQQLPLRLSTHKRAKPLRMHSLHASPCLLNHVE